VIKKEVKVKNTFQKDDSFSIEFSKESESGNAEILGFDRENNIYIITSNDCNVESNGEILQKIDERGRRVCVFDSKGGFLTAVQLQQKTKLGNAAVVRIDIHGNIYQMINNCRKITGYTPGDRVEIWKYEMRIE